MLEVTAARGSHGESHGESHIARASEERSWPCFVSGGIRGQRAQGRQGAEETGDTMAHEPETGAHSLPCQ